MARVITDYLDLVVKKYPDKLAVSLDKQELTFKGLQVISKKIATSIIKKGLKNNPIIILLDKSPKTIVSLMGVAYSGNYYTILDNTMPVDRMKKIIEILSPKILITDEKNFKIATDIFSSEKILLYEQMRDFEHTDDLLIQDRVKSIIDTDILYILFTSGSTGDPKGVIISHKATIAYTEWGTKAFNVDCNTIIGNQTPFYFSMSVFDIFQMIKNGSTLYIIPKIMFSFPMLLLRFISEKKINLIYWVPSALCLVANLKALGKVDISCVDKVLFAGEVMPAKQYNLWKNALPKAYFANLYGPTETTDICNYYPILREINDDEVIPIGNACENAEILILDENDRMAAKNEIGELCVKGSILAYGYFGNKKQTEKAFIQNPINDEYPEIIYRTGDLVRYNCRDELIFVCRKDFQIKHMGHRIELGEVELAISSHPDVERVCCLYDEKRKEIVTFYIGSANIDNLSDFIRLKVPKYMLPNKFYKLKSFPININGKIDRIKLREMLENG